MKLLQIKSSNYRTLQDITIDCAPDYCSISGKNNSGKSSVIRLIRNLLQRESVRPWLIREDDFDYTEDKTQWIKEENASIEIIYVFELNSNDDSALINFINKMANIELVQDRIELRIKLQLKATDTTEIVVSISDEELDESTSKEIVNKIKNSNLLFLHNSTTSQEEIYFGTSRRRAFYEIFLSDEEQKQLEEASKTVNRKIRKFAREHKADLNNLLGRLSERYDVEFSTLESGFTARVPFGINLKDKNVEVPISDWGSGTQNRTFVLMSILQANRIKTKEPLQDRITPIVVVEEPESFLHPSAQAEFGRLLRELSFELGIQIIVTTHSPYMLNQREPQSNILLSRVVRRGKALETFRVSIEGDQWMAPFAEHLGISATEFQNWRPVFSTYKSKVLLVEGETDKQYFEYIREARFVPEQLSPEIEIVPYGGKDALKNTMLVKFVLSKFDNIFITFDLDASNEVQKYLERLNLKKDKEFISVGVNQDGKKAIEGLLPEKVLSAVNARETDLVMQMASTNSKSRKDARRALKKLYLEEFKRQNDYAEAELKGLITLVRKINKRFRNT